MDFSNELTQFPSTIHRIIYSSAREITPFERSFTGISDPVLKASCETYYQFILTMLSDMYDNPEEYRFPVLEPET